MTMKQSSIVPVNGHMAGRHEAASSRRKQLATQFAGLVLLAALTPLHRWWAAEVLLVPLLLVVPGIILLRALRVPGDVIASFPVYVPCASLIVLLASGLAVDLTGPLIGIAAPHGTAPGGPRADLRGATSLLCEGLTRGGDTVGLAVTPGKDGMAPGSPARGRGGRAAAQQRRG